MGKDVKVTFSAVDKVSDTLRGMKGKLESFSHSVTKIAAGIGLADSFKAVGRAIKASIEEAAAAYPKLGAGLTKVSDSFQEFRIQAGAAFLEILQPAVPLLESILGWATRLATQIPDAFDGFRIVLVEISAWFESIPAKSQLMFAKLEQTAADFIAGASSGVLSFWGITGGYDLAAKLSVHSAMVIASATKTLQGIEAATDRTIAKYGGTHDYGSRAPAAGEKAATDAAQKAAEQALINRQSPYRKGVVDNRVPVRGGVPGEVQSNEDAGLHGGESIAGAYERGLEPLLAFNEALTQQGHIFDDLVSPAMSGTIDAIAGISQALAESIPAHSAVGKAAQFAAKSIAKVEGGLAIIQGAKKIAEFSFPPNPAGIASGAGMVAQGIKLLSFSGSGGGAPGGYSGGTGGSGGVSGQNVDYRNRDLATRGKLVINVKNGVIGTNSPEFRDLITEALGTAADLREIEFTYT